MKVVCSASWLLLFFGFICLVAWQLFILQRHDLRHEIPAAGADLLNSLNTLEARAAQVVHPAEGLHLLPAIPPAPSKPSEQSASQASSISDTIWKAQLAAVRRTLAQTSEENQRISEENKALRAQLKSQDAKSKVNSCCNDGETMSNVAKDGNEFRKIRDTGAYDAHVLWKGNSICAKAGQTDKHLRIGLAPSRMGDHQYEGGVYAGLFPSGQLYPSRGHSTYNTSDIICLRVVGADIIMYKNGERYHTWIHAARDCMIVKLWMQEYDTSVTIVHGTKLSPTSDCKEEIWFSGDEGSNQCPPGMRELTKEECQGLHSVLGGAIVKDYLPFESANDPRGCFVLSEQKILRWHYNTHEMGTGRQGRRKYCTQKADQSQADIQHLRELANQLQMQSLGSTALAGKPAISPSSAVAPTGFLAPQSMSKPPPPSKSRPYYDIVALIFSTASAHDAKRMELAESTWLNWHGKYTTDMTMTHIFALCQGDPGTDCRGDLCTIKRPHVVVLPCKASYTALVAKSSAGYRYIAENFNFLYVLKADVDSVMDVPCAVDKIRTIPKTCRSWGLGLWRKARDSKVFGDDDPSAGKYANPAYKRDTGNDWYPPYLTGWAFIWSGDIARFLGMGGLPQAEMPVWRDTWTIEDAAIGTFVAGLDICRISLAGHCPIWTDVADKDFKMRNMILEQVDEDELANEIEVDGNGGIRDIEGPHKDNDIPGLGDLANVQAKSLKHCAAKCFLRRECRSFEYSSTVTSQKPIGTALNCQLTSVKFPRTHRRFHDYHLYIRLDV